MPDIHFVVVCVSVPFSEGGLSFAAFPIFNKPIIATHEVEGLVVSLTCGVDIEVTAKYNNSVVICSL